MSMLRLVALSLWLFGWRVVPAGALTAPPPIYFDCDPCIERSDSFVRVLLHGSKDNAFWEPVADAIRQTARGMGITLEFELYDSFAAQASMADDIRQIVAQYRATSTASTNNNNNSNLIPQQEQAAVQGRTIGSDALTDNNSFSNLKPQRPRPDVLLTTLPSTEVEDAARDAVEAGIPVFGLNSGYHKAAELGFLAFVGMDEYEAGIVSGREFLRLADIHNIKFEKALFVLTHSGNFALEQRYQGVRDALRDATQPGEQAIVVDKLTLDGGPNDPEAEAKFDRALGGCGYQAIMASATTLDLALQAKWKNCAVSNQNNAALVPFIGSFDTNTRLYRGLAVGDLSFAVSQQAWLQAAMATVMASLYASTGMRLQASSEAEFGTYLSGPRVVTIENLPSDTLQVCETQGFPICNSKVIANSALGMIPNIDDADIFEPTVVATTAVATNNDDGGCICFDRPSTRIAAVVHGTQTDSFWWRVRDAAYQAGVDMNVEVEFALFPPGDETRVLHSKMASRMISYCQQGIHGLIVSIPSAVVEPALTKCQELNVPIISINAGGETAERMELLHHVAQDEYLAGYLGGQALIREGATRGICLNHVPQLSFIVDRCLGLRDAFAEAYQTTDSYVGMVAVLEDNEDITIARTNAAVQAAGGGNWEKLGLLVMAPGLVPPLLTLLEDHPEAIGGTFDNDDRIGAAIEAGQLVFGIDQQSYLQGYVPVLLLTWFAQTRQSLVNRYISSGPSLVLNVPSAAEQQCQETSFAVCPPPIAMERHQLGNIRVVGDVMAAIVLLTATALMLWVVIFRRTMAIRQSQPFFLVMVCLGAAFMGLTILPLSVDDGFATEEMADAACMLAPWLFTIGFTITFAALYSKIRRLNKLIRHAEQFRRITVKVKDVMKPFLALLALNFILLTTWTVVDPMYYRRTFVSETESYGLCRLGDTGVSIGMGGAIFFVNVLALIGALVEAYKSRKVSYELTDSGSVAIVVASILQVAIVGVPILPLVRDDPQASFLLKSGLVFVISMSTLLFIFVPKLRMRSPLLHADSGHGAAAENVMARNRQGSVWQMQGGQSSFRGASFYGMASNSWRDQNGSASSHSNRRQVLSNEHKQHSHMSSDSMEGPQLTKIAEEQEAPSAESRATTMGMSLVKEETGLEDDDIDSLGEGDYHTTSDETATPDSSEPMSHHDDHLPSGHTESSTTASSIPTLESTPNSPPLLLGSNSSPRRQPDQVIVEDLSNATLLQTLISRVLSGAIERSVVMEALRGKAEEEEVFFERSNEEELEGFIQEVEPTDSKDRGDVFV